MIIHAGDFTGKPLVDALREIGPFRGVHGNIDGPEVRKELPAMDIVQVADFRIGLNHPAEGGSPHTLDQRLRPKFPGSKPLSMDTAIRRRTISATGFSGSTPAAQREHSPLDRKPMAF